MSDESSWWDGFTDGLGELGTDLLNGTQTYLGMQATVEAKEAEATKAANENATATQQVRILEMQQQAAETTQKRQTYLMVGGAALVFATLALFALKK